MGKVKIYINPELGMRLKDFRNTYKVKAKDIADYIEKSAAYISKLEKGEIQQIEKTEFIRIVNFITKNEEGYDKFFEFVSDLADEEELEKSIAFSNFDWVERMLPVSKDLLTYINNRIDKNNIDIQFLTEYINQNDDLESDFFESNRIDKSKIKPNIWHFYGEVDANSIRRSYVWIQFEKEYIESILSGKQKKTNYLSIFVILYHVYKLEELAKKPLLEDRVKNNIKKKVEKKLHEYKFYTLADKSRRLSRIEEENVEADSLLSKFDVENRMLTNKFNKYLSVLSDYDVDYTNDKLKRIIENFEKTSVTFAIAFMALPINKIAELPSSVKKEFLRSVEELIDKYCNLDDDVPEFEKF